MRRSTLLGLLLFASASISAIAQTPGVWEGTRVDDDTLATGVFNDSGGLLAKTCSIKDQTCSWTLVIDTPCDEKSTSSVLMSARLGATAIQTTCIGKGKDGKTFQYMLHNPDDLDRLFSSGGVLGIAFALEGGQFKVVRFNVDGAANAIKALTQGATAIAPIKKPTGLRDQVL